MKPENVGYDIGGKPMAYMTRLGDAAETEHGVDVCGKVRGPSHHGGCEVNPWYDEAIRSRKYMMSSDPSNRKLTFDSGKRHSSGGRRY